MTTHTSERVSANLTLPQDRAALLDRIWATARIGLGWTFLWAFLDKLFGWGFATPAENAWINGGRPTQGFLANSAAGPFEGVYTAIAGQTWADWLFMIGLAGIGAALMLGIGMRIASASGTLLLVLMWTVALPPVNNPVIDDHLLLAVLLVGVAVARSGHTWGLGDQWNETGLVKKLPILR